MQTDLKPLPSVAIKIFLFSFLVASLYAWFLLAYFKFGYFDLYPDYYGVLAKNLLNGKGFIIHEGGQPVVWRPPLYPLFLTTIYVVFGVNHLSLVITQILIHSLCCVLIFYLFHNIFNRELGIITAIFWSFYPLINYYTIRELPTVLFTFIFLLFLILFNEFHRSPDKRKAFFIGILQGMLILTKLFFKGFPYLFILYMFFRSIKDKHNHITVQNNGFCSSFIQMIQTMRWINIKRISKNFIPILSFFIFGLFIVLTPWVVRNYSKTGHFPVIGVGGGFTVWFGNNLEYDGLDYDQLSPDKEAELKTKVKKIIGEGSGVDFANDKKLYLEAIKNFKRYPTKSIWLMVKKSFRLWFSVYSKKISKYQWLVFLIQIVIIATAILGISTLIYRKRFIWPLILPLIYFQFVYMLFTATVRYCMPVMPIAIGFASYGLENIIKKLSITNQHVKVFKEKMFPST